MFQFKFVLYPHIHLPWCVINKIKNNFKAHYISHYIIIFKLTFFCFSEHHILIKIYIQLYCDFKSTLPLFPWYNLLRYFLINLSYYVTPQHTICSRKYAKLVQQIVYTFRGIKRIFMRDKKWINGHTDNFQFCYEVIKETISSIDCNE